MTKRHEPSHRLDRSAGPSLRNWERPIGPAAAVMEADVVLEMGWGRLLFGQTFGSNERLVDALCSEQPGTRDIALYLRDPHVLLSLAPHEVFLDPSHTYRLWRYRYRPTRRPPPNLQVRRLQTRSDAEAVNRLYATRKMVTANSAFMTDEYATRLRTYLVAQPLPDGPIVGTVTGVDHVEAFHDPENGSSLWCLAVDPQAQTPGVGEALVRQLAEHYFARGRDFVDLSVLHDNTQAITLYEKLGFERVPVFCAKHKNSINERLFTSPAPDAPLNPYATIIVDEARRRGIGVAILDVERAFFRLSYGGRSVTCRESLTELTSAIAMSWCDDKRLTHRVLSEAGLHVPEQIEAGDPARNEAFLARHGRVVVKPARGEQGAGVSVDLRTSDDLTAAIATAEERDAAVVIEEYVAGADLRVVVIDYQVVAAAVRRPPEIVGTGNHTVTELIEKYNRRRLAATGGESHVPLDAETERCVRAAGRSLDDIVTGGESIVVRRTANLHTGGTIHDVTGDLHPELAAASVAAARALEIPVVGLDLAVPDPARADYAIIEANERPGLANHEPQPTAARFLDLLFPQTAGAGPVDKGGT